jgi:uncharacterized protein YkwD
VNVVGPRQTLALGIATAATAAVLTAAPAAARVNERPTAHAAAGCKAAGVQPSRVSRSTLRSAILCLVNRERRAHGLRAFRRDERLRRAADRHARDMVRRRYFAHERTGGPDLGTRLRRAGWRGRAAGETIAYGCGPPATPRATVRAWMNSPGHRAILLDGGYRRGGPGVAKGTPARCRGATWVLDVGRK